MVTGCYLLGLKPMIIEHENGSGWLCHRLEGFKGLKRLSSQHEGFYILRVLGIYPKSLSDLEAFCHPLLLGFGTFTIIMVSIEYMQFIVMVQSVWRCCDTPLR